MAKRLKHLINLNSRQWQITFHRFPDHIKIYLEVAVGQGIALYRKQL